MATAYIDTGLTGSIPVNVPVIDNPNAPAQTTGGVSSVTDTLLKLLSGGAQIYKTIADRTGTNGTTTTPASPGVVAPDSIVAFGLTKSQVTWIIGGGAVLAALFLLKRR